MHQYLRKAIAEFGLTDCPHLAGYILPNGDMLNFAYDGYQRDKDHREVSVIFDEPIGGTEAMIAFEHLGAIRWSQYGNSCNISLCVHQDITRTQIEKVIEICDGIMEVSYDLYGQEEQRLESNTIQFATRFDIARIFAELEEAKCQEQQEPK